MKFQVQASLKNAIKDKASYARLGNLIFNEHASVATPTCMLYTVSGKIKVIKKLFCFKRRLFEGCVPSVTNDLLNLIPHLPKLLELPLPNLYDFEDFELLYFIFINLVCCCC